MMHPKRYAKSLLLIGLSALMGSVFAQPAKKAQKCWSLNDTIAFTSYQNALELYSNEENPYCRAKILDEIAAQTNPIQTLSTAESKSLDQIIALGIEDKYPRVVAATAALIGSLKMQKYETRLGANYDCAILKFSGYGDRVQHAIIASFGKTGGYDAKTKLKRLLAEEGPGPKAESVLRAMRDINDPALVADVDQFRGKMEILASKGKTMDEISNPFVHSAKLAKEVIAALSAKKGN